MTIEQQVVNSETVLNLHLAKSGGFAIQLMRFFLLISLILMEFK